MGSLDLDVAVFDDGQRVPPVVAVAAEPVAFGDHVNGPRDRRWQRSAEQGERAGHWSVAGRAKAGKCLAPKVVISATFPSASRRTSSLNARNSPLAGSSR